MRWAVLLLLFVATTLAQIHVGKSWLEEEKRALLDIKSYLKLQNNASMDTYSLLPSWDYDDPNSDICGWERVTCNFSLSQVIHISLHNLTRYRVGFDFNPCSTSVSSFNMSLILSFKHLTTFNLSYNCFRSLIGIEDGRSNYSIFTKLENLDISHNYYLNESIIKSLTAFTSLANLFLGHCSIGGPFPIQELSILQNLELLDLSYNLLSSPFLTAEDIHSLQKLKKLRTLDLADNILDKNIFKYLLALPALRSVFLTSNSKINGSVDDKVLANLNNLEVLILRSSELTGPLPIQGLCRMKHLQELDLSGNNFTGTLDTCLGNLISLRALDLSKNSLNGSIPTSLFSPLVSLEYLSLSYNNFEGLFSLSSLANHSKLIVLSLGQMNNPKAFQVDTKNSDTLWIPSFQLEYLKLSYSQVNLPTRTIPSFLSYQKDLKFIDLSNNNLVGMFPNWLFVNNPRLEIAFLNNNSFNATFQLHSHLNQPLYQLRYLKVSNNKIQGKLPKNIGYFLPHLEYLDVSSNMLDGDIPASIGEMSGLMTLDLSYNNFSGSIPKDILVGCVSLDTLVLSNNSFQGPLFPTPLNLASLKALMIDNNKFNGTLDDGVLPNQFDIVDVSGNNLSGMLPDWIVKSPLQILSVSSNNFEGTIPEDLCKTELAFIDLSQNRFSGTIPPCLFSSTMFLHLHGNSLNGTIPEILPANPFLLTVDLRDNKLSGTIPKSVTEISSSLMFLLLAGNVLQGQLPSEICQLQKINILDLSHNNFTGSIPTCLNNVTFGKEDFALALILGLEILIPTFENKYEYPHFFLEEFGPLHSSTYGLEKVQFVTKSLSLLYRGNILQMMSGLDLSSNQLTGEIPYQIGDLLALHSLNLSHNHLNGSIPESFHNLKEIESLDLSYNKLNGQIPLQLEGLNSLSLFNVSYNNLSGKAPDKGQFANFDDSSYKGNSYLSWSNSNRRIATPTFPQTPIMDETQDTAGSTIDLTAFYWTFVASYVIVILTMVAILWINPYWRRVWFYYINRCLQKSIGHLFEDTLFF